LSLVVANGWEFVQRSNASGVVAVLAVTAEDEIVLTEQFRPPVDRQVIDLPAGLVGDESPDESEAARVAAARELEEETGYAAGSLRFLAALPTSPGLTSEMVELFVADGLTVAGPGGGVAGEKIDVHRVSRQGVAGWLADRVAAGSLIDPKVYAALWWWEQPGVVSHR